MDSFDVMRQLSKLYISSREKFLLYRDKDHTYQPKWDDGSPQKLTDGIVIAHLNQEFTIGVFAGPKASKFVCFDVDMQDQEIVRKVIHGLTSYGFKEEDIHISSSGNKGYHVEMFFSEPVNTAELEAMYAWVIATENLNRKKVEFRPKYKQAIKLPLGIHQGSGKICWYLDRETLEPITGDEGYQYVFRIKPMDRDMVNRLLRRKNRRRYVLETEEKIPEPKTMDASIVNANALPPLKELGTRHDTMVKIAVYLKNQGKSVLDIYAILMKWVAEQDQSLIASEPADVEADARSIARWAGSLAKTTQAGFIYVEDLRRSLAQRTRTRRRLVFLVAAFTRTCGKMCMPAARIGEYIGVTETQVNNSMAELVDDRIVVKTSGGYRRPTEGRSRYSRRPNTYCISERIPPVVGFKPQHAAEIPGERNDIIKLDWNFRPETFSEVWCRIITSVVPADQWKKVLAAKELKELKHYQEEHSIEQ